MTTGIRTRLPLAPSQVTQPSSSGWGPAAPEHGDGERRRLAGRQGDRGRGHRHLVAAEAGGGGGVVHRAGADVGDGARDGALGEVAAVQQHRRGVEGRRVEVAVEPGAVVTDRHRKTRPGRSAAWARVRPAPSRSREGSPARSPAEVASAERTSAADQSCRLSSAAAIPLVRAAATDVPEPRSHRRPRLDGGSRAEHADGRGDHVGLDEPGGRVAGAGPRDQALGSAQYAVGPERDAAPGVARSQARRTRASSLVRCTVGSGGSRPSPGRGWC